MQQPLFNPTFLNLEYFFNQILVWLDKAGNISSSNLGGALKGLLGVLGVFVLVVIIYSLVRIFEIQAKRKEESMQVISVEPEGSENKRWEFVQNKINSENPSDWRLAIIEADLILDDLLVDLVPAGEDMGDRLKKVNPAGFRSLNSAWEAHKVRNSIAHAGSDFSLSKTEAKRVIAMYEEVFHEFGRI